MKKFFAFPGKQIKELSDLIEEGKHLPNKTRMVFISPSICN